MSPLRFPFPRPVYVRKHLPITRSHARCLSIIREGYAATIPNLRLTSSTRVIYQGFTGKVSTANATESIAYGTNIVGGTTPNKSGEHLGLPLYPTLREAAEKLKPDATAVFVGAQHAAKAIEDAIEAEIPLIVAIAEFLPLHDMLRISEILRAQSKSRLVGANAPGVISPLHHCRIGFQPIPCYRPGHIGIIAKSGTLSYETVGALTRAGLGQSLCIGMGGDIIAGTNMVEALEFFENDDDTEAIILAGEVGGRAENDAAGWISEYRRRSSNPKPIAALVAGHQAVPGRIMGHAGAFRSIVDPSAAKKARRLLGSGIQVVRHPTEFATVMPKLMAQASHKASQLQRSPPKVGTQTRAYHSMNTRPRSLEDDTPWPRTRSLLHLQQQSQQRRHLHFENKQAKQLLKEYGVSMTDKFSAAHQIIHLMAITVDRSKRRPAIAFSPTIVPAQKSKRMKPIYYKYSSGPPRQTLLDIIRSLPPPGMLYTSEVTEAGVKLIETLTTIFKEKEAYSLQTHITPNPETGMLEVCYAKISFDDSAFKSSNRQADIHSQRDIASADPDELSVEKDGIVYIKLSNPDAFVATLINGAGLAMNALDVLHDHGAYPTNFLDTGGKATSETIKKSFEVILKDPRVKVIFVNIFGGLTRCDMVAEGIILGFKELEMKMPVVVRLRGTNEAEGQRLIAESGLPLHAFDDFFEAVEMCKKIGVGGGEGESGAVV